MLLKSKSRYVLGKNYKRPTRTVSKALVALLYSGVDSSEMVLVYLSLRGQEHSFAIHG